jgi:excisionase family DNA binding protein
MTPPTPTSSRPPTDPLELSNGALAVTITFTEAQLDLIADRVTARLQPRPERVSPWLDTKGAAAHLACGVDRVHDLVALRKLTPRRDGRRLLFKRSDLDAYLEASA